MNFRNPSLMEKLGLLTASEINQDEPVKFLEEEEYRGDTYLRRWFYLEQFDLSEIPEKYEDNDVTIFARIKKTRNTKLIQIMKKRGELGVLVEWDGQEPENEVPF